MSNHQNHEDFGLDFIIFHPWIRPQISPSNSRKFIGLSPRLWPQSIKNTRETHHSDPRRHSGHFWSLFLHQALRSTPRHQAMVLLTVFMSMSALILATLLQDAWGFPYGRPTWMDGWCQGKSCENGFMSGKMPSMDYGWYLGGSPIFCRTPPYLRPKFW